MQANHEADPFEALVAGGVSVNEMDPSATPTLVGLPDDSPNAEEEIVWIEPPQPEPAPEPLSVAPQPEASPPEPEPVRAPAEPDPIVAIQASSRRRVMIAAAIGASALLAILGTIVFLATRAPADASPPAVVEDTSEPELEPLPLTIERPSSSPRPAVRAKSAAPAPAPKRHAAARNNDFLAWPGDAKAPKPPPPTGEPLKRPAMDATP